MSNNGITPSTSLGRFHRYPARFGAETINDMMDLVAPSLSQSALILDPFAGSGSTMAVARQRSIPSVGVELSALGVLISQVRLSPPEDLEAALRQAESWASVTIEKQRPVDKKLVVWLGQENADVLSGLISKLKRLPDPATKRWLALALSAALRPSSVWLPGSIKPQIDPDRTPPPIQGQFKRAARNLYRDCQRESRGNHVPARIIKGDARLLPLKDGEIDAVVTSPPYWIMYDYVDIQRLTYMAFRWPSERDLQIGRLAGISPDGREFEPPEAMRDWYRTEFRKESTAEGRALRAYIVDMRDHIKEISRVLRSNGLVVYAVADSHRRSKPFQLVATISELLQEAGFEDIHIETRPTVHRRILPAGRDPVTGRFSSNPRHTTLVKEKLIRGRRP